MDIYLRNITRGRELLTSNMVLWGSQFRASNACIGNEVSKWDGSTHKTGRTGSGLQSVHPIF